MALSEFDIITRYFTRPSRRPDVVLGVGDDGALLRVPAGMELVVTIDTLVSGIHFPPATDPYDIGWKTLAVSLSDLAAMGAEPAWATLALTLPEADAAWLTAFSRGLFDLADQYGVALIGGDTTRGPLAVTLQAHGLVPTGQALRRAGARPGDRVYVTGTLGDATLALPQDRRDPSAEVAYLLGRLDRPTPRVAAGLALRGIASAVIDISDGLGADLGHILEASGVGAVVWLERIPRSPALKALSPSWEIVTAGGDDYELCVVIPHDRLDQLSQVWPAAGCDLTPIGEIQTSPGLIWLDAEGNPALFANTGFRHFP
jgi:thiamine-monophosphate kinase